MYLGDSEGRGSFLSLKNDSEARINVFLSLQSPPQQRMKFVGQGSF